MGLFDFLKKRDPNKLTYEESLSAKLFLKLIIQAKREDRRNFEEEAKQLAVRIYEHSFQRADIPLIPVTKLTDALAVVLDPNLVGCLGFLSSIREGLHTIFDNHESLNNNINQSGADISMLQLLQIYSGQLTKFIKK